MKYLSQIQRSQASARGLLARAGAPRGPYRKTVLENGIRIVTEHMPGLRSLALGVVAETGPQHEAPAQGGLAHLTEHMVFQGTSSRSARQIAQLMDLAGGQFGGFTARDYTGYYAHVLDEHCTYAIDLLGDLLLNSILPPERLASEREVILREIAAGQDAPATRAHDLLKATAWADHALGRPIAGTTASVRGLTREDVIYFLHTNYTPDRLVISAAGNVDHDQFVEQTRDAFWRMLGANPARSTPPARHRGGAVLEQAELAQAYFAIGIPAIAFQHADRYAMHVFNTLLGGGSSARLFRRLREENGLVYDISSEYQAYRHGGMLVIEGSTAPEHLCQVLFLTLQELGQLALGTAPPLEEEVWKAKTQVRRQHLLAAENPATRMSWLATQELYFDRYLPSEEVLAAIEAVDAAALRRLAYLHVAEVLGRATVAVVGPALPEHYDLARLEELVQAFRG